MDADQYVVNKELSLSNKLCKLPTSLSYNPIGKYGLTGVRQRCAGRRKEGGGGFERLVGNDRGGFKSLLETTPPSPTTLQASTDQEESDSAAQCVLGWKIEKTLARSYNLLGQPPANVAAPPPECD